MNKSEQTYSKYLQLDAVLNAQKPQSDNEHDEMLFIIIHQVYELWFKQMLHEGSHLNKALIDSDGFTAIHTLNRILKILKTAVSQIDILETMTPLSFAAFRDRLDSSSGFQSAQFRMFEFWLGNKNQKMIEFHKEDPKSYEALHSFFVAPNLFDNFLRYLDSKDHFFVDKEILNRDYSKPYDGNSSIQKLLVNVYKNHKEVSLVCEKLVDLDEGVQEWRYRHVKMVERTIGQNSGTGGSAGAEYLKKTLFKPCFPDLWLIRSSF